MLAKRHLRHTAAGLLGKFMSHYNDIEGYWALGVLYSEAIASGKRVEIDLLAGSARPASPACASVADTFAGHLRRAIAKHGAAPGDLRAATVTLEFGLPPVAKRPGYVEIGDPFLCTLRLVASDGCEVTREALGHCLPYDQFHGSRSTRYKG